MRSSGGPEGRAGVHVRGGGFWVRGEASPSSMTPTLTLGTRQTRRVAHATDNKENIPPAWAVAAARRRAKLRNSPLPNWYPRTPLRDITIIVKALEKRRRARAAASRQRIRDLEATPEAQNLRSNEQQQLGSDHASPSQVLTSDISEAPGPSVACFSTQFNQEQPNCTPGCLSAFEQPSPVMPSSKDLPSTEYEKKLERSIDQIEKAVKKHLKKSPKAPTRKSTRVLMSMR